jgi:hypothetical protein
MKMARSFSVLMLLMGWASFAQAEEIVGAALEEPTSINEQSAAGTSVTVTTGTIAPVTATVPVTTGTAVGASVQSTTATTVGATAVAEPVVAIPVIAVRNPDIVVSWKKMEGTVQSVDRNNHLLTVQDKEGKNIQVSMNEDIQIKRRGQTVAYADVAPHDRVVLRYQPRKDTQNN